MLFNYITILGFRVKRQKNLVTVNYCISRLKKLKLDFVIVVTDDNKPILNKLLIEIMK